MKKLIIVCSVVLIAMTLLSLTDDKKINGEKVLQKMYKRYAGNWYKTFTFSQVTENYKKDSIIKTSTWHEAIVFPDYFRISIGDLKDGNAVIFNKDSMFNFNKGKLVRKSLRDDDIPFLIGGMYFLAFDKVKDKIVQEGYDYTKAYETVWEGKKMYVLGANSEEEKANKLYIEKEKLIVVRFIRYKNNNKEEAILSNHQQFGKAWSETNVAFFINDKLFQKEKYFDCKVNEKVDLKLFDPYNFVR